MHLRFNWLFFRRIIMGKRYEDKYLISTLNQMGFVTKSLDPFSQLFVDYAKNTEAPCLDIGAGFGVATLSALKQGARMIANDIDQRHLDIIKSEAKKINCSQNLELSFGLFPQQLIFDADSIAGILICRVLHFYPGEVIQEGLKKCYHWLKKGGKIFIIADSIYHRVMKDSLVAYFSKKEAGELFPGMISNFNTAVGPELGRHLPEAFHLFDTDILSRLLLEAGFSVEKVEYFARPDYPEMARNDGREGIAIVAVKE